MATFYSDSIKVAAKTDNEDENRDTDDEEGDDEDDEEQNWEDWDSESGETSGNAEEQLLCLFCDSVFNTSGSLFQHCAAAHRFDFRAIKSSIGFDFYGCFKLINYIRIQVMQNRCWCCEVICESKNELQHHLHEAAAFDDRMRPWDDDKYLTPLIEDDSLLYSFGDNEEEEDEDEAEVVDKDEILKDLSSFGIDFIDDKCGIEKSSELKISLENGNGVASRKGGMDVSDIFIDVEEGSSSFRKLKGQELSVSSFIAENEIMNVNKNYFGSYSSFGIHREMISDKVRTDAYRQAILENPSLFRGAVVMDVGCGTGILSLFASQAGASRVIAIEASQKMAYVAAQIAKDNGLLWSESTDNGDNHCTGVIEIVQGMVEQLENTKTIEPHSVDILLSEWMGYCLLYECMLSSVIFARDKWLKPGGAVLPDTATMFVAGFGRGGTSLPFWENVYGFNMSCIGKDEIEDAAQHPLVDIVDGCDVVTYPEVLQTFDLVTMTSEDMDFTAKVELSPKMDTSLDCTSGFNPRWISCHGVVLWFDTGFTKRFCKEMPTILSTSPYTTKTHWSQTVLTFKEPIAMALGNHADDRTGAVGSDACPACTIQSRISIARGIHHRSIDISLELSAVGSSGRKCSWPVQMFNLQ